MVFHHRARGQSKLTWQDQVEFLGNVVRLRLHRSGEFLKFALVGLSGVFVNLGCYLLLERRVGLSFALAAPPAIELSILSNFLLNDLWTFRRRRTGCSLCRRLLRFHAAAALAGAVNYGVFVTLVSAFHLYDVPANLAGILTGLLISYGVNSLWTWQMSPPASVAPPHSRVAPAASEDSRLAPGATCPGLNSPHGPRRGGRPAEA